MSALVMALMAGMAVGSDGTEQISEETQPHFMGNGYWEGIFQFFPSEILEGEPETVEVKLEPGRFNGGENWKWIDEGRGKCRVIFLDAECTMDGAYKRESGKLIICYGNRPARFKADAYNSLLILEPVKPPK